MVQLVSVWQDQDPTAVVQFIAVIHSSKCEGGGGINITFVVRKLNVVYLNWKHPDHFSLHYHRDNISIYTVMCTVVPTLR